MSHQDEVIKLLRSIDASLKTLVNAAFNKARERQNGNGHSIAPDVADDRDLDGKWGDPELRFKPRDWNGDDFKGCNFSQCPPELLDLVADSLDYFARKADQEGDAKKAKYQRLDAARARGWSQRLRNGWQAEGANAGDDSSGFGASGFEDDADDFNSGVGF